MNLFAIAETGMNAAAGRLTAAAWRISGMAAGAGDGTSVASGAPAAPPLAPSSLTGGAVDAQLQGGDPALAMVDLLQAKLAFKANLRVFQAGEQTMDTVLSLKA